MDRYLDMALISYSESDYYPFHMPGHKRCRMGDWTPESIDITEIEGFDNLHHAEGIIKEAQERLAALFGSEQSFFLVNGSTCGLLSAICGSVKKGGCVLMGRNCHKAVYHAAYLMELKTAYLYPEKTGFGIQGSIRPEEVKKKLEQYPDVQAVVITSPTYDGVVSDIAAIADLVHEKDIPLIVDEAHGAHLGFSEGFPQKAIACGADLCIESLHKTLPCYTQTAVLHIGKTARTDISRVKRYLGIFQSSSPSYVLMAGIDRCTRMLQQEGKQLFADFEGRLKDFYKKSETLKYIQVFPYKSNDAGIWAKDISKILISGQNAGLNGQQLYDLLLETYHLQMEMASGHYVTALTSVMDTDDGFERLSEALREIDGIAAKREIALEPAVRTEEQRKDEGGTENTSVRDLILTPNEIYQPRKKKMEIYQAIEAGKREIPFEEAEGCISGEFIYLYPPGIPLVAPGEIITKEMLAVIRTCRRRNMQVQGMADMTGERIQIADSNR